MKECYYCNFDVNPKCIDQLRSGPIKVIGFDNEGEIRVIEYPDHLFCVGTLFEPQVRPMLEQPYPLVTEFLEAIIKSKYA